MAQSGVYLNPNAATRKDIPYLLDVQADLLDQVYYGSALTVDLTPILPPIF